jgi:hypothetical protein
MAAIASKLTIDLTGLAFSAARDTRKAMAIQAAKASRQRNFR